MAGNNGTVSSNDNQNSGFYGYNPNRGVGHVFVILFLVSTLSHIFQLKKYRMWWILLTVCVGGVLEIIGWSGRLWSSYSPLDSTPFKIQIAALSLAPTPFLAANFIVLGKIITILGPSYSRLAPRRYTIIFCSCDFLSILVQGGGGGVAASAITLEGANVGARIMLVGIILQLVFILAYVLCATEFLLRYYKHTPFPNGSGSTAGESFRGVLTSNIKTMWLGLSISTFFLIVRSIYRVIELSAGWEGKVLHTEIYFNIFDGAMIVLAFYTLNIFHPGRLLNNPSGNLGDEEGTKLNYVSVRVDAVPG